MNLMTLTNLMKNSMITLAFRKVIYRVERYPMPLMMMTPIILSHLHLPKRKQLQ